MTANNANIDFLILAQAQKTMHGVPVACPTCMGTNLKVVTKTQIIVKQKAENEAKAMAAK